MKTLRHLTLLIIFCCAFTTTRAQYVTIPDAAFSSFLQTNFPGCMNGNQMDTTCPAIVNLTAFSLNQQAMIDLTGIQYFDNLDTLIITGLNTPSFTSLPVGLKYLDLSNNSLTTLPTLPPNLETLILNQNSFTILQFGLYMLKHFECKGNPNLTSLPTFPQSLLHLDCSNCGFGGLPSLPGSLRYLDCTYNRIVTLPVLPAGLQYLNCRMNRLSSLPALNISLKELICGDSNFPAPPALPDSLINLEFQYCSFTTLPALPQSLNSLIIFGSRIDTLPALPPHLKVLDVEGNYLTTLPALPASLQYLKCGLNQLTSLPALPDSLEYFKCNNNSITGIGAFPPRLYTINCSFNQITFIPELPDSIEFFSCANNPNLHCLPQLKTINYLDFANTAVACISNYGKVNLSNPLLNSKPMCGPFNTNGCQVFSNISGIVYQDTDSNCLQNNSETGIQSAKVMLLQNNIVVQQTYTAQNGDYSFDAADGNYTITVDASAIHLNIQCPASLFDSATISLLDSVATGRNFAMQCKPGFDVGVNSISASGTIRPAAFNTISIQAMDIARLYGSTCNTASLSGQLILTFTGPARYISPAPNTLTPVVSGNTLTYIVNDWSAVNSGAFNFIIQVDTFAQANQQVCFDATVTPNAGDNNVSNNQLTYCVPVVNSYDPNDKAVYPISDVDVNGNRWLTYTVRFQNTGNAPAEHIYITDTIDTDVDNETFQLLAYSFAPQVIIKGNAVRFNFANINLPDSVNDEPNSHGYVQYKVKIKDTAPVGTVINNTAFIYFDFNAPVVTNTTINTLALPNSINAIAGSTATMQLYPNPAQDILMINLSDNLTGGTLTLSDVTGRSLNTISITANHNQLNTGALSSGVYLVTAVKEGVRVVQRLVVSK